MPPERDALLRSVAAAAGLRGDEAEAFAQVHDAPCPVSVRINPLKFSAEQSLEPVPWASGAYYLPSRPSFTFDPLLHAGAYYVQEASSMSVEQALRAAGLLGADVLALDLCASPGGKSTQLLSLLGQGSLLVCNEAVRQRIPPLCDNLSRWGRPNVCVTSADVAAFGAIGGMFDLVVVDAPCSGEGMFRKDAEAMAHWSPGAVTRCAVRQSDILRSAWRTLRPGGWLIYSTCTFNKEENEAQVALLHSWGGIPVGIPMDGWPIIASKSKTAIGYRFMPHRTEGEGFFLSLIKKAGDDAQGQYFPRHRWQEAQRDTFTTAILGPSAWDLMAVHQRGSIRAIPQRWADALYLFDKSIGWAQAGTETHAQTSSAVTPSHAMVLSCAFHPDGFEDIPLGLDEAVSYLRGNPVRAHGAKGFAIVSYRGLRLGWAKGAGNRWNNLYPAPLRIRDTRTPVASVQLPGL